MSAPAVQIENLIKEFPDDGGKVVRAVDDVSLDIADGEFFALLGPSGCGKTTTLRVIAGFEQPTSGRILLRGAPVQGIPPFHRPVNTVFQDYALFPHMNVLANVMFGLRMSKVDRSEARTRAEEALEMVQLPGVANRSPSQLSGGQKQRVALARALVNRPAVLLLDEPLGALDLKLRKQMQIELKELQQRVGITFIYVTHDQEEALTMADRIAVMNSGKALQVGRPADIYERPESRFVADFIGETNFLEGQLRGREDERATLELPGGQKLAAALRARELAVGDRATLAVRPEKVTIHKRDRGAPPHDEHVWLDATVLEVHYLGTDTRYDVQVDGGTRLVARVQNRDHGYDGMLAVGDEVRVGWLEAYASVLA